MNLAKSYDVFKPEAHKDKIHIIGCGSIGATVAENLARLGLTNFVLWDFDTVASHNIANQIFVASQIGSPKIEALADIIMSINPDISEIKTKPEGWNGEKLDGYVFMCVDSIKTRREIVTKNKLNKNIKAVFDFRTGLTDAQHYAADWGIASHRENLLNSMNFTDEDAKKTTPVSACNTSLSVCPTIRIISAYGVANFMNFWNDKPIKTLVLMDAFDMTLEVY